jgi:hypothetical protein
MGSTSYLAAASLIANFIAPSGLAAFTAGFTRFLGSKFMRVTAFVSCPAAFSGNLALTLRVHCRKSTLGLAALISPVA